jgi:MoaA/NifB/PqqE/SkfB family radical SAM enzyme
MDCVDIKVGFSCNNDCLHCVTADKRKVGDLPAARIKEEIAFYQKHTEALLVVTGGEPTIRPELPEVIKYAHKLGFTRIEMQTNGRRLANEPLAKTLAEAGLTSALVALHAPNQEIHDQIIGRRDGFSETTAGMRNLISNGVIVRTNTVISKLNLPYLEALVPFLAGQFPEIRMAQLTFPHPNGNAYKNFEKVIPQLRETAEVVVRTLRQGLRREIWFLVEAIPPCLLPGFEKHNIDLRPLQVIGSDMGSGFPEGRVPQYREALRPEKRKGKQCASCSLVTICDGIWKEYAEKFGTEELSPVRNLEPKVFMEI